MDRYTVLFVDDEPFILRALTRMFRGDNLNVLIANSGEEALTILSAQPVQLLVTDNMMPGLTGIELIKRVKQLSPDTIRIILSGQSEMDAVLSAVNDGEAFRFILKPWIDTDLKANVYIALAHHKLQQDIGNLRTQLREKDQLLKYLSSHFPQMWEELPKEYRVTALDPDLGPNAKSECAR